MVVNHQIAYGLCHSLEGAVGIHGNVGGVALTHGDGRQQSCLFRVKIGCKDAAHGGDLNPAFAGHGDDAAWTFAHERLAVETSLAGDDEVGFIKSLLQAAVVQNKGCARQQLAVQQMQHQGGDASGGTAAGPVGDIAAHDIGHVPHAALEQFDLLGRCTFLGSKHGYRAAFAAQGRVDVK